MEVYVNYPKDSVGLNQLSENVAKFHATLLLDSIDKLNLDRESKKRIIKKTLEVLKEKSEREKGTSN